MKKFKLNKQLKIFSTNANLIRFVCALLVIVSHSFNLSQNQVDPISFFTNGQISIGGLAVAVFFFYSGLYVSKSLARSNNLKDFAKKRFIRIFPQLWIVVILCAFLLGPIMSTLGFVDYISNKETYIYLLNGLTLPIHNLPGVFENNIYGQTVNGALWTMPVEVFCYIALMIIWVFSKHIAKNKIKMRHLDILALIFSLAIFAYTLYAGSELLSSVFRAIIMFFIGCLFYEYADKITLDFKFAIISFVLLIAGFFTPVLNFVFIIFFPYFLCYLSLGICQIKTKNKLFGLSYEMYLIGFPIQQTIIAKFGGSMPVWLNITIAFVIVIAIMLIVLLIKHIVYFKKTNK